MNIGRMRELRARYNYSQKELAKKVGVTRQTIVMIEKERFNPSLRICKGICRELGANLEELFGDY